MINTCTKLQQLIQAKSSQNPIDGKSWTETLQEVITELDTTTII